MARRSRLLLVLLGALAGGCGGDDPAEGTRTVVATTPQLADIARNVAGSNRRVVGLIPAGADPHDYEVRPSDVEALAEADLIVRSGGEVDEWLDDAIEAAGGGARVLTVLDRIDAIDGDPHWWHDPRRALRAARAIRQELGLAPDRFDARLAALDEAIAGCWSRVPRGRRRLVTTHDSLRYYAERYGLEVVGAVMPGTTTQGQASAGDVDELVRAIRREGVRAVFPEAGADAGVESAIAKDAGVQLGRPLHTDSLAGEGPASTYLGSLIENTRALVSGVTHGAVECPLP